jgi:hypothetical protein
MWLMRARRFHRSLLLVILPLLTLESHKQRIDETHLRAKTSSRMLFAPIP